MSEEQPKHPGGRPTKYEPRYCDEMIDFMAQGYSIGAFAGHIRITRRTLLNWKKDFPEFADAYEIAQATCQLHWEKRAIEIGKEGAPGGAPVMTIFALKNMGSDDWRDKIEHSGNVGFEVKPLSESDDSL